jgi:tRNA G37 N-methylase TrmD
LIPGVLSDETSAWQIVFKMVCYLVQSYTRPVEYKGWKVRCINERQLCNWQVAWRYGLWTHKTRRPD